MDVIFNAAPIGMFASSDMYHVDFQVALTATTDAAINVDWALIRSDGSAADSGTALGVRRGNPVSVMAMAMADNNEQFMLELDPNDAIKELGEDNNSVQITAFLENSPGPAAEVDVRFTDAHYHGFYYYNDLAVHFYAMNPTTSGQDAHDVTFTISEDDRVIYGPEPVGRMGDTPGSGTVPAPTADQLAGGTDYPIVQTEVPTRLVFGDGDPNNPNRPTPGVHVFKYELQAPGDTDITNNTRYFTVDVPANKQILSQDNAGSDPDIQLQDPHYHQYPDQVFFHFFIRNVQIAGSNPQVVKWKITRDYDGAVIFEDGSGVAVSAGGLAEIPGPGQPPMQYSEPPAGLVRYRLTFDPGNEITEADESDNEVSFMIDWTPTAPG